MEAMESGAGRVHRELGDEEAGQVTHDEIEKGMAVLRSKRKPERCRGLVFRADVGWYFSEENGLGFTVRLRPLKKLSCPGCDFCMWQWEVLREPSSDLPIVNIDQVDHGELYTLDQESCVDWETGIDDGGDLYLRVFDGEAER